MNFLCLVNGVVRIMEQEGISKKRNMSLLVAGSRVEMHAGVGGSKKREKP